MSIPPASSDHPLLQSALECEASIEAERSKDVSESYDAATALSLILVYNFTVGIISMIVIVTTIITYRHQIVKPPNFSLPFNPLFSFPPPLSPLPCPFARPSVFLDLALISVQVAARAKVMMEEKEKFVRTSMGQEEDEDVTGGAGGGDQQEAGDDRS
eukprot:756756-Hanusia_phi.AAC.1